MCCVAGKCNGFQCDELVKRTLADRVRFLTFEWWPTKKEASNPKPVKAKNAFLGRREKEILSEESHYASIQGVSSCVELWKQSACLVGGIAWDFAMLAKHVSTTGIAGVSNSCHLIVCFPPSARAAVAFLKRQEIQRQFYSAITEVCKEKNFAIYRTEIEIQIVNQEELNNA